MLHFDLKARLVASVVVFGGIGTFVAPSFGIGVPLLMRNTGNSMPRGFYVWHHAPPATRGR